MTDIAEPVLSGRGPSPALTGGGEAEFKDYIALMKPRVMSLAIFTALVGLIVAPGAIHPVEAFAALVCIAVGAGASGALNMWWDADIDARMSRTALRGVPAGRVEPGEALAIGLGLSVLSVALLFVFAGALAAGLLAFTIFFYAVIYTMWLKRSTPQNIVIGGAAGAFPPMIGWAVATGDVSIESVLMFAVIFLWTPPHFWALAIFRSKDYARAGVPMLPVARGDGETRRQILAYSVLLAISTFALAFTSIGGPIFFAAAVVANIAFLRWAWVVARRDAETSKADSHSAEKKLFSVSLFYLFGVFLALALETPLTWAVGDLGWPVWF